MLKTAMVGDAPWRAEASRTLLRLGPEARSAGRELLDLGGVRRVEAFDDGYLDAEVWGPGRYCVVAGQLSNPDCACRKRGNCEHVAAALMHLLMFGPLRLVDDGAGVRAEHGQDAASRYTPRGLALPDMPDLQAAMASHEVKLWLDGFRKAQVDDSERLVFLLRVTELGASVGLGRQRRGKANAWLAPRRLSTSETLAIAAGDLSADGLEGALQCLLWQNQGVAVLDDRLGALGLQAALQTGRLVFEDPGVRSPRQTLSPGPPRAGRLAWSQRGDYYRTEVELDAVGLLLVPTIPAYYIDRERLIAGRVEIRAAPSTPDRALALVSEGPEAQPTAPEFAPEIDPEVLQAWFDAPVVPACAVADVAAAFKAAGLSLPVPTHVPQRVIGGIPRGQLVLYDEPGAPAGQRHRAALWFVYEDVRVLPCLESDQLFKIEGEGEAVRVRVERHWAAEEHDHRLLVQEGFRKLFAEGAAFEPDWWALRDDAAWARFTLEGSQRLQLEGIEVVTDPSFSFKLLEPADYFTEIVEATAGGSSSDGSLVDGSDNQWFDLDFGVEVHTEQGVERISVLPVLLGALRDGASLGDGVLVDVPSGGVAKLPAERLAPLLEVLLQLVTSERRGRPRINRWQAMDLAHVLKLESETGRGLRGLRDALARGTQLSVPALPKSFSATLRGYQAEGLAWLGFLGEHGIGGVLADDMGLGKTVQILALISARRKAAKGLGPSLVVAPTSVLLSWTQQLAEFAPKLKLVVWHGGARRELADELEGAHVVLTTYALLRRDVELLKAINWDVLVLDEAQAIKNPQAVAGVAARSLTARQRIAVTGTPLENHLGELWSLFAFVAPGVLGSQQSFQRAYRAPIEKDGDQARLDSLRRRVAPLMLRRTKEQVAADLPPKTIVTQSIELGSAQRDLYETVRKSVDRQVREEIARRGVALSKIAVLDALLKLRQVCCDPSLVKSVAAQTKRVPSAKRQAFFELIETLVAEGRRVLVFSQFVKMLDLLGQGLVTREIAYARLTGATTNRTHQVEIFQSGSVPVFLISLKAGGVGLNLTRADAVIHYDPWWNPAVEAQATDRAHRIGQLNPVFVHRLIARGTVEEKIVALQARKAELAEALLGGGGQGFTLDEALIDELLAPLPH